MGELSAHKINSYVRSGISWFVGKKSGQAHAEKFKFTGLRTVGMVPWEQILKDVRNRKTLFWLNGTQAELKNIVENKNTKWDVFILGIWLPNDGFLNDLFGDTHTIREEFDCLILEPRGK